VVGWVVERGEVVEVEFDFGVFDYLVVEFDEDVFDFVLSVY